MKTPPMPTRFHSLDVLRGIAALSVVFWHWQHFFLPLNREGVAFDPTAQPFYDLLFLFYRQGFVAVQLFFCLSGFIFFWLYATRIAARTITPGAFAVLRLSRLYPLHLATLLAVLAGQWAHERLTGTPFVYPTNDAYYFVLQLFFASAWGLSKTFSFNGPIWSVSVEILLYALFFAFCWLRWKTLATTFLMALVGHYLVSKFDKDIASGVECFFLGGTMYLIFERIVRGGDGLRVTYWLPAITALAWLATVVDMATHGAVTHTLGLPLSERNAARWPVYALFPATLLSLALLEAKFGPLVKRLSFIGDLSYSSYLLHFPLQLALATVVAGLAIDPALYYCPWVMAAFFIVLIALSLASHRYFEMPMQRWLRKKFAHTPAKAAA
jgi:peptidoglycan/LPS O-acetylase OafA/YrhL